MKSNNRLRVLYAESNDDACSMLKMLLGLSQIDVSCVETVRAAYLAAQADRFELYLLDGRLSDGSGLDLCRQLRRLDRQTPIVFYSGDARETDKQNGLAAGADAYLTKPACEIVAPTILQLVAQQRQSAMLTASG